jgi:hypothetical protein
MVDEEPDVPRAEPTSADESQRDAAEPQVQEETVESQAQAQPAVELRATPEPSSGPALAPAAAEDDDGTVPIDPDSLRVDRRVGHEMFGDLYTDTTTYGPAQFGSNNTLHYYVGKLPLDPIIGELPGIEELMALYMATGADEQLDDLISQRSTVCLVGPRNSGRYTTARALRCAARAA